MPFLQNYAALQQSVPIPALVVSNIDNCSFVNYTHGAKNCQHCIQVHGMENGVYCSHANGTDVVDCLFCLFCELCYECTDCVQCYGSTYLNNCTACRDCHFCTDCVACQDCVGCVALTHKQYCIDNKQYTKTGYEAELKRVRAETPATTLKQVAALHQATPQICSRQRSTQNCPYGDNINNCINTYWAFDSYYAEDCGYMRVGGVTKNCWDISYGGGQGTPKTAADIATMKAAELCYESVGFSGCYHCFFIDQCTDCTDCYHSSYLRNCKDCFGCVGLTSKQYCVLNNQLTKDQYEQAIAVIKHELGWQ